MRKPKVIKSANKEAVIKADHKLFGHMVLTATSKKLDMRAVLAHPLGPLPRSLGNCDGTLKKTSKATLPRKLEKSASLAEEICQPTALIIDGMNLVQKVHGDNKTFGELSESLFMSALHVGSESYRIDVVFDVYADVSIKNAERVNCGSDNGLLFSNIVAGHKIKQWRRLLSSPKSKANLIKLLTSNATSEADSLFTTQEEADTRMLLHAKHAADESSSLIIASEDTDVLIICLSLVQNFACRMYIKCGAKNRERFVDVQNVASCCSCSQCVLCPSRNAFIHRL